MQQYAGHSEVYGFYLMDEPDPTGQYAPLCPVANLKAESDWVHANMPGKKTFIVMMNMGSDDAPSYASTYNPANSGIDLYGLDPYPCQVAFGGCHYTEIQQSVAAAEAEGIPLTEIVPVYQAFGGGGYAKWQLPTVAEEQQILAHWASVVPTPALDYVYAWGSQSGDTALGQTPALQQVFAAHNAGTCGGGECTPTTCAKLGDNCGTVSDGCGGTLDCGACTAPETCGGGGTPNQCGGTYVHAKDVRGARRQLRLRVRRLRRHARLRHVRLSPDLRRRGHAEPLRRRNEQWNAPRDDHLDGKPRLPRHHRKLGRPVHQ